MNKDEICTYILKGLKETVLHAISLHDNSNLKALKKNLNKFELMQFRINNRGPELSDYTEILNEHVSQLNQKTREKGKEIDELKRQLIERDREYKREINHLRENIQQINITGRKNKSVNFDDEEINNRYKNNNYNYNEDRGRSYRIETNYRGQRREYRDKSPYPERFNYRSRESSRNRQYGRDRSLSRERHYYNNIQNETNTNQVYEKKPTYKYIQKNYEHRDNSRDNSTRGRADVSGCVVWGERSSSRVVLEYGGLLR
ncbi:GATA zinc finger domain-containing protein 14-like [Aphis craccivora]|uniref:GATA zinc finger domain-containing protein 14-like n=1 Tax=Aphis craccivora TaxID=307492 RepID=A0A6G0X397_APHCR|nr:GATA zinc finger domain-containing protein 14-like [Aphis craccivora]